MSVWFWIFLGFWLLGGVYLLLLDAYQHGDKTKRFRWFKWGKFKWKFLYLVPFLFIASWLYIAYVFFEESV